MYGTVPRTDNPIRFSLSHCPHRPRPTATYRDPTRAVLYSRRTTVDRFYERERESRCTHKHTHLCLNLNKMPTKGANQISILFPNSNGITNYDINASVEIWNFFSRYNINGLTNFSTDIVENNIERRKILKVIDLLGREAVESINTSLFYIYNDGTVEKRIILE